MIKINEELASLARKDPLVWGILHVDLGDGKKWEVETRAWMKEIYSVVNPYDIERSPEGLARRMSVIKSTQSGLSTMGVVRMLHFLTSWPSRVIYTLPRQMDSIDFATTRLDPILRKSPYLRGLLGSPDSVHAKRIGDSFAYILEMSVEPRSIPADIIFIDEVDLSDPANISTALNRLDASRWKLNYFFSTPTLPAYGIHSIYEGSDMREWLVKCPTCNHEQLIEWETHLKIVGTNHNPEKVYFGCIRCGAEITLPHIQTGRWIAQKPDLSNHHIGFHVSQILSYSAWDLYRIFRDPQTNIMEFYRKRLGMPYEISGGSITRDDIMEQCFLEPYPEEDIRDKDSQYFMGVDQGNELQVLIGKLEPESNVPKLVHAELVPMEKGFDRIGQLMNIFKIKRCVVDANPNRHEAVRLVKAFPNRVLIADYIEQKEMVKIKKSLLELPKLFTGVAINRTLGFDALVADIKDGKWMMAGELPNLSSEMELVIDQMTAIKRDLETRKTPSGEVQVAVWRKIRADHFAHSWLYLKTAIDAFKKRGMRIAVIGKTDIVEESLTEILEDDIIKKAISSLAEVPLIQLADYLANWESEDYEYPFPLSHKIDVCRTYGIGEQYILKAMEKLVIDSKPKL